MSESENRYKPFSTLKMLAYSSGGIILSSMWTIRGYFQFFAESAYGVTTGIVLMIGFIYILWDALNDPVTGYLLDRSKRFTSKRGKRFPYILIGGIGAAFFIILLYLPLNFDATGAAIWILIMLLIWDQFQTLFELSSSGLTVDIFRDSRQRRNLGAYGGILGAILSITFGSLPSIMIPLFGGYLVPTAYFYTFSILGIVPIIILIPYLSSVREPVEMIQLRARLDEEGKSSSPFKEIMKRVLKDKHWMSLILVYLGYVIGIQCVTTGTSFYVVHALGLDLSAQAPLNILFVLAGLFTTPLWWWVLKKIGARKTFFSAACIFLIAGILFPIFGSSYFGALLIVPITGIGNSCAGTSFVVATSETIDNATVKSGKREETSYNGVLRFFSATGIFFQILIFLLVEMATGFDPTSTTQVITGPMKFGIMARMSLIPGIIYLITALIYLKFNKITVEVAEENKKKLIEMGL